MKLPCYRCHPHSILLSPPCPPTHPPTLCEQMMADSLQSSMGTLVGSPKLPFFLVVPGAAAMTGMLEASFHCERWPGWAGLVWNV